jgi:hypothetical protein
MTTPEKMEQFCHSGAGSGSIVLEDCAMGCKNSLMFLVFYPRVKFRIDQSFKAP